MLAEYRQNMTALAAEFIKTFHKHPAFTLFLAFAMVIWVYFALANFARAGDVDEIKTDVYNIKISLQRGKLEQRIHDLEAEIFNLERLVDNGDARADDYDRLASLKSELGTEKRKLLRLPDAEDI